MMARNESDGREERAILRKKVNKSNQIVFSASPPLPSSFRRVSLCHTPPVRPHPVGECVWAGTHTHTPAQHGHKDVTPWGRREGG